MLAPLTFYKFFPLPTRLHHRLDFPCSKPLLGAWITNRRIQAESRPCIFCGLEQDSLQHIITCDIVWAHVSDVLLPFLAFIDTPSALLGIQPVCCYQILGTHYAFLTYHSLRIQNAVSASDIRQCLKSIVHSTTAHNHQICAHLGKCSLRLNLRTQTTQAIITQNSCTSARSVSSSANQHDSMTENFRAETSSRKQGPTGALEKGLFVLFPKVAVG